MPMASNPILIESYRGSTLESFHRGAISIVDENGEEIFAYGNTMQWCYPRSTMKLFQHLPFLLSGLFEEVGLTPSQLALMCGSHNGEDVHVKEAISILDKNKIDSSKLQCGAQWPELKDDQIKLFGKSKTPSALHNNCSGKHAGFLLYCQLRNWPLQNYLDPEHPLQKEIRKVVAEIYEFPEENLEIGTDGCSAPVYAMPLKHQALAYKNLVNPSNQLKDYKEHLDTVVKACTSYPEMVAGSKRYCTDIMKVAGDQIVAKTGADGVYCMALRNQKWGIAIKIDDGSMGPQYLVAQQVLNHLINFTEDSRIKLSKYTEETKVNYSKKVVGKLSAHPDFATALSQRFGH